MVCFSSLVGSPHFTLLSGPNNKLWASNGNVLLVLIKTAGHQGTSETGQIRFRRAQFQTPSSVSFLALTEFRGESSVSSPQPIICVPRELTEFFAELTEFVPSEAQWVLFSETVLSKQYSARFLEQASISSPRKGQSLLRDLFLKDCSRRPGHPKTVILDGQNRVIARLVFIRATFLGRHVCRTKFVRKSFRATKCLTKLLWKFPQNYWAFNSVGPKQTRKNPTKFPTKGPCKKLRKYSQMSFCRCAGRKHSFHMEFLAHLRELTAFAEGQRVAIGSGESKVLVFFWVWPFNMHAPYILSADDLDDFAKKYIGYPPFWRRTIS